MCVFVCVVCCVCCGCVCVCLCLCVCVCQTEGNVNITHLFTCRKKDAVSPPIEFRFALKVE